MREMGPSSINAQVAHPRDTAEKHAFMDAHYLGGDAGRRVHSGAVERGSVESIRAVLWYADIRGFTIIADSMPGPEVIALLDEVFEALAAPLRPCGGQVLKFIGDGMLAI